MIKFLEILSKATVNFEIRRSFAGTDASMYSTLNYKKLTSPSATVNKLI